MAQDAAYYTDRGLSSYRNGEYDKAIADYDEAIRLGPDYAFAYNNRGLAYYCKKEYDKAITDYDEAIRLRPDLAVAFNDRGRAFHDKKEYDKAIEDYNEAIRLRPNYFFAYHNRGALWRCGLNSRVPSQITTRPFSSVPVAQRLIKIVALFGQNVANTTKPSSTLTRRFGASLIMRWPITTEELFTPGGAITTRQS